MAAESRRTDPSLEDVLFAEPFGFEFFQAVRLLESVTPERHPVGHDAPPRDEIVRFRVHNSLNFPASAIHDLRRSEDDSPSTMLLAFLGLTGPSGVLPRHYTELILERERRRDTALAAFLDLFNHRVISLFYRAWQKYRVPITHEQARRRGTEDTFSRSLFAHFGMGTAGLRGRLAVEDPTLVFYTGLLAQQPRSASALAGMLTDYFAVTVRVAQFRGAWLPLAEDSRSRLGSASPGIGGGAHNILGRTAVVGRRFWDQQARFRLRVGPLGFAHFCDLLPSGRLFGTMVQLTRFFVGQALDFDIQLVLRAPEVPACRLGERGPRAPRLGWSTWLGRGSRTRDVEDTVLGQHWTARGTVAAQASGRRVA